MRSDLSFLHKQIKASISTNPCITLHALAVSFDIDRRKIEGCLQEMYGCGFRELKNQIRLNYIIVLLTKSNPRMSIKEIAAIVGLSPNHLSRFIRSMTGRCARELRDDKEPFRIFHSSDRTTCDNINIEVDINDR
jgi:AraC-like DNA-binding protein